MTSFAIKPLIRRAFTLIFFGYSIFSTLTVLASEQSRTLDQRSVEILDIQKILILNPTDNVKQIYAKTVKKELVSIFSKDLFWDYQLSKKNNPLTPKEIKDLCENHKTDAALNTFILKNQEGFSIKMTLYSAKDGLPLLQTQTKEKHSFSLKEVKNKTFKLYENLKKQLPYSGWVLSRKGTSVTINFNSSEKLKFGDKLQAYSFLKIEKHPRFDFLIEAPRTLIGELKVIKTDGPIVFAKIVSEKFNNAIKASTKISSSKFISYKERSPAIAGIKKESFQPSFGKITFQGGLSSLNNNQSIDDDKFSTSPSLSPKIHLSGELWLTPSLISELKFKTGAFSASNSLSNSSPQRINYSFSQQSFHLSYRFLLKRNFNGPKLKTLIGFTRHQLKIDPTTPSTMISTNYSGLSFGFGGYFPFKLKSQKTWGLSFQTYWLPYIHLEKDSSNSSSSTNSGYQLSLSLIYPWYQRFNLVGTFEVENFRSSFKNKDHLSQLSTDLFFGLEYLF